MREFVASCENAERRTSRCLAVAGSRVKVTGLFLCLVHKVIRTAKRGGVAVNQRRSTASASPFFWFVASVRIDEVFRHWRRQ